jgi:DNA-binding IclR family transcriptional regulator
MSVGVSREVGSIQVLSKAAAVLNELAERGDLSAAELADSLGEPRSSIYRLLASLTELGYVENAGRRGTYRLGVRLIRLGSAVIERASVRRASLPAMEDLHREVGETTFLCVRRGFRALCIERFEGEHVQVLALGLGGTLPLHVGGAPLALLASEPRDFWREYISQSGISPLQPRAALTSAALKEELEQIRERGYAISDEDITLGIAAVGAPIFDFKGAVQGAISIAGTRPMILGDAKERSVELVMRAAESASRAMGFDRQTESTALTSDK